MDILLTSPINKTHYCVPSLGLGYLISALKKSGFHSVSLLDSVKENMDYDKFAEFLKENKPKILGIQCFSFDVPSVNRMLRAAKEVNPHLTTIVGGPHPTAVSGAVFNELDNLDFAIQGEGEISLSSLVKIILSNSGNALKEIPGLVYKEGDRVIANNISPIQDLDSLDMPAWYLMDPRRYQDVVQGAFYKSFPVGPIVTSRGCPYECAFCANRILMGRGVRFRSIEKVIDEIEHLTKNYNVKEIHILDDNFTVDKKRVLRFCNLVKEKEINVDFAFPNGVRIDSLDQEVLAALKEAGVYSITVGIESGSQRILDKMKKQLTLGLIRDKVYLIKRFGFVINAFFIIGYPDETREEILNTIEFAKSLPIDAGQFSSFLPLPGTEATKELLNSGKLKSINYSELFYSKIPFTPEGITKDELKKLQRKAFLSFYLRAHILIRLVLRVKSLRHLASILVRAGDYLFKRGKS